MRQTTSLSSQATHPVALGRYWPQALPCMIVRPNNLVVDNNNNIQFLETHTCNTIK